MTQRFKQKHSGVTWHCTTDGNSEWCTYVSGDWKVYVMDCDGDRTVWDVSLNGVKLASGEIEDHSMERCAEDVAMDTAIACLKAMQAEPGDDDH